jgi:type III secretion system FlhB-like substrate exporter
MSQEQVIRELRALLNSGVEIPQHTYDAIAAAIRFLGGNP